MLRFFAPPSLMPRRALGSGLETLFATLGSPTERWGTDAEFEDVSDSIRLEGAALRDVSMKLGAQITQIERRFFGTSRQRTLCWMSLTLAAVALIYCVAYLGILFLPGNSESPLGWWGGWDQSWYLKSAAGLASGNLDPSQHWYPLGYPLLAMPFFRLMPNHAFFVVNLAAFVAMAGLMMWLGRQLRVGLRGGALSFLIGVLLPGFLLQLYVEPWSTTPVATIYIGVFVLYLAIIDRGVTVGRLALLAGLVTAVAAIRPVDVLPLLPVVLHVLLQVARLLTSGSSGKRTAWRAIGAAGLVTCLLCAAYLVLHWSIYGFEPSPYMKIVRQIGLQPSIIPFRYFMNFVDPRPFFGTDAGILERYPLVMVGLWSLIFVTLFVRRLLAIATAIWMALALYLAYPDFPPTALWHYHQLHYWKWLFPVLALLSLVAVQEIAHDWQWHRGLLAAMIALPFVVITLQADARPVSVHVATNGKHVDLALDGDGSIHGLKLSGLIGGEDAINLGEHSLVTDRRTLRSLSGSKVDHDFHAVRVGDAVFLVLNRPLRSATLRLILGADVRAETVTALALQARFALRNPFTTRHLGGPAFARARYLLSQSSQGECPGEKPRAGAYPARDSEFIRLGYRAVLGREPDEPGFLAACNALLGGSVGRPQFIERLVNSPEFASRPRGP